MYDDQQALATMPQGVQQTEGFGVQQFEQRAETAMAAAAAQAQALVQAKFIMAMKRPRDIDQARERILKACRRPAFAEVALYAKPVGGSKIIGPSIRLAEECIRSMGNVDVSQVVMYEDERKRVISVTVIDLESNASYNTPVTVEKTVERRSVKDGQTVYSKRQNSEGKTVYLVAATEDELANKQNAAISKAIRNNGLRLVPADIVEDAVAEVKRTQAGQTEDREAAKKRLLDAFAGVGVSVASVKALIGHDLESLTPSEIAYLRQVFTTIRDGEATIGEYLDTKQADEPTAGPTKTDTLKEKLAGRKSRQAPADPTPEELAAIDSSYAQEQQTFA